MYRAFKFEINIVLLVKPIEHNGMIQLNLMAAKDFDYFYFKKSGTLFTNVADHYELFLSVVQ